VDSFDADASDLVNSTAGINRVIARVETVVPLDQLRVWASALSPERLARLRQADETVRRLSHESGFDRKVWQFPVVLIPLGTSEARDSVVLRPIDSMDGMTAQSVPMDPELLHRMSAALLAIPGIAGVFYDLTHKPPATIEWE
ncbi:MAG: synthase (glutamine-hydrolyzing), partial [Bryobacterales bacterium]|nr:synthase (glutamine-hydrolyzing) [Bryobacterales bacterium]